MAETAQQSFALPEAFLPSTSVIVLENGEFLRHLPAPTPKVFLHKSYTGQKCAILSIYINRLFKSKDLERVKGIEPSS